LRIHIAQFAREIAARQTWTSASMTVQTASASPAVPTPKPRRRWAVPSWRCWHAWPVSSLADVGLDNGQSSSTCRRCCTDRAAQPGD
jgi:hypothetical protein